MEISGNKGEWSELYVLFKLLGEKKIYAGDGNLNKLNAFYPVLKILRDEVKRHMEYSFDKDEKIVIVTEDNNEIARIIVSDFLSHSNVLFKEIQKGGDGKGGAFKIPSQEVFLKKIHCEKIKAKSLDKSDIHIVIHDYHTGLQPNLGFSIKSDAGASPTLLNASAATSFVYKVNGDNLNEELVNSINDISGTRKIQDRVNKIYDSNMILNFDSVENDVFYNNLVLIDSKLPDIIAWMMVDCYRNRDMNIMKAVERITKENPFNYDLSKGHDFYGYKIKRLLVDSALGMLPSKIWNGHLDATGGYLIVKNDGDIVCYHDRNALEDYLFKNTKFETPTGKRYNLGNIYKSSTNKYFFNLNLQIRFC